MRIDLHAHSAASDGTEPPSGVIASAAAAGLDVVALTDHDTTRGWAEAAVAAREHGVALVRGVELSCRHGGRSLHLLSYLHDPEHPALLAEAERVRAARHERARTMVDLLAKDFPLTWDDVEEQVGEGATVGRPHIADALVALGVVADRSAAFSELLATGSPYWVPHHALLLRDAIGLVLEAGGVPVLAHPGAVARGRVVTETEVATFVGAGLAGLEVWHRDNPPAERARLEALADRFELLATGSSDYHGAGKPNRLGEHLTDPTVLELIEGAGRLEVIR
ncbi:PHP domain-containing protein [Actinotalea sp. M2MS4P-6]|uniref:PHP domain-containing protein n=1 Tax=Actinotalea sp. M2MS4P-6 TaxID=2983762 RepID=UPI0021E35B05|nr:PHP domain-containing protein [Actinotalea sp. M2MS4P-6]MCV2395411.1 PHP domain-containing protein [Actinotalea sp. M2MS4P-6]